MSRVTHLFGISSYNDDTVYEDIIPIDRYHSFF